MTSVVGRAEPLHGRLRLVGDGADVPLVTGQRARYVNLDYAASAPALEAVAQAVDALLGWYSSVHRGAGFKSRAATAAYEGAREAVRLFVGARPDDAVIFTRNTTDAINLVAATLPDQTPVIAFAGEHHANLLPWQRSAAQFLPVPESPAEALERLEAALQDTAAPALVAMTGASNVTGEVWPIGEAAEITHRHGGRILIDAAQLAPHAPIDMAANDLDLLAFSGHKLYAPFGAGALVGRAEWLSSGDPFLRGGGAVKLVTVDEVVWADLPDRQEAGSPNVVGAVAMGVACDTLREAGMERIAAEEADLLRYALSRFATIDGFEWFRIWPADHRRLALLTFNLRRLPYDLLAAALSAEHGIGIRHGCFCAHPLMMRVLHVDDGEARRLVDETRSGGHPRLPGAARLSFGLGTTRADVDRAADALSALATDGPAWTYRIGQQSGEYEPDPDPRELPDLPFRLADSHRSGEGS